MKKRNEFDIDAMANYPIDDKQEAISTIKELYENARYNRQFEALYDGYTEKSDPDYIDALRKLKEVKKLYNKYCKR